MPNLSRRAYARSRNLSEASIRRHLASGVLTPALTPDGLIDADLADGLLKQSVTRKAPARVPAVLKTAQQRKNRALARQQGDELAGLRGDLVRPAAFEEAERGVVDTITRVVLPWPARIAPEVAGRPGSEVYRRLDRAIYDLRNAVADEMEVEARAMGLDLKSRPKATSPELDLDSLTPVELKALLLDQQAEKLELERALARGELALLVDLNDAANERHYIFVGLLRALPGRVGAMVEHCDVAETEALLAKEIAGALAVLQPPDQSANNR